MYLFRRAQAQSLQPVMTTTQRSTGRLLGAGQRLPSHKPWESLVADAELASSRPETDDFILATLELINVPRGEDDLVSEKLCFRGGNPDKEIGGKRDCERKNDR